MATKDKLKVSRSEEAALLAERDYWLELEEALGWTLYGWTYRQRASFITPGQYAGGTDTIQLTGRQRDDILKALDDA